MQRCFTRWAAAAAWVALATGCACEAGDTEPRATGEPVLAPAVTAVVPAAPAEEGPRFTAAGELLPPKDYRTWMYVTSGFAMGYGPLAQQAAEGGVQVFDTVFVERPAYERFVATGVWPESTMFVLELRTAEGHGSIVTNGKFQTDLLGLEAAVKDSTRFAGGWGYFELPSDATGPTGPAPVLPTTAACYECHAKNGAVEQTFTQFYPTLFAVARAKGTVRADFVGMPPTRTDLFEKVVAEGWPAGERLLADAATRWPGAGALREATLNQVGYQLLQADEQPEALGMLEYVTRRFPGSANAWDSLSEVQEQAGQGAAALASVAEGLRALDGDTTVQPRQREALSRSLSDRKARLVPG